MRLIANIKLPIRKKFVHKHEWHSYVELEEGWLYKPHDFCSKCGETRLEQPREES